MQYLVTCRDSDQAKLLYAGTGAALCQFGYRIRCFVRYGDTWVIDIIGTGSSIMFVGDTVAIDRVKTGFRGKVVGYQSVEKWLEYQYGHIV